MLVAVVTMWLFRVGLAYVFVKFLHKDVVWVWYAMFVDWLFRTVVYVTAFRKENALSAGAGRGAHLF